MLAHVTFWRAAGLARYLRVLLACGLAAALLLPALAARAQAWEQAVVAATGQCRVAATAADAAGNVYIAGSFSGTVQFGSSVLSIPAASFGTGAFVAKWSSATQAFAWAQQVQGTATDYATAVAVRGNAVYVAGYFYSPTATFGTIRLSNAGSYSGDVFVAKLLDAGTSASFAWAQRAGGSGADVAASLAVDGQAVYVAGSFEGQADFGATRLTSLGSTDAFVARLTDAGGTASFGWAQAAGSTAADAAYALAAQGPNLYLTGYFGGAMASFGPVTVANASNPSTYDVYVAKLVDAGASASFAWALPAGSTARDIGYAVAASGPSVYVAGIFEGATASFGGLTLTNTPNSGPNTDAFVAKLTDAGSTARFEWLRQVGGLGYEQPVALAANGPAVYLAGYFGGPTATFDATTLTTLGSNDLFVARLTDAGPTGSYTWVQQAGGPNTDFLSSMAVLGNTVYVGGSLTLPARFGSQQLNGPSPTTSALSGYWARLTDTTLPLATAPAGPAAGPAFAVYPSPAQQAATVRLVAPAGLAQATLTLYAATGQLVHTQQIPLAAAETSAPLSLLGLAPGFYNVRVQAGEWHRSQTLLVK